MRLWTFTKSREKKCTFERMLKNERLCGYTIFWYVDMMKSILGLREMCTWYLRIKKVDIPAVRKVSLARAVKET